MEKVARSTSSSHSLVSQAQKGEEPLSILRASEAVIFLLFNGLPYSFMKHRKGFVPAGFCVGVPDQESPGLLLCKIDRTHKQYS